MGCIPMSGRIELSKLIVNTVDPVTVKIIFSEPVYGIDNTIINANSGSVSNFSNSADPCIWTGTLVPLPNTNQDNFQMSFSYIYTELESTYTISGISENFNLRTVKPTVNIVLSSYNITTLDPVTVSLNFSESVTDVTLDILSADNGTLGNLSGSGTSWTAQFTPLSENNTSNNKIKISSLYKDIDGNFGIASESLPYSLNTLA